MREFSSRWFAKLEISGLDGRREMSFLVVYFCNSGHVSKKSTKSETGPWLHLQIKKKENQKKPSLCRISYLETKISTKKWLEKIIALHLNTHCALLSPWHNSFSFLLLPFMPGHFALTLYVAVMFMFCTEFSLSHLGIPSAGTEQSHRLLSLSALPWAVWSADLKTKDHAWR